jgi:hypothetical protein
MTASQSSSDMRTSSPSRVMPALFTRMSSDPNSALRLSTSAAQESAIADVTLERERAPPAASIDVTTSARHRRYLSS